MSSVARTLLRFEVPRELRKLKTHTLREIFQ